MSSEEPPLSGKPLAPGPTRLLNLSLMNLVDNLGLSPTLKAKPSRRKFYVLLAELLLISSAVGTYLSIYFDGRLEEMANFFDHWIRMQADDDKSDISSIRTGCTLLSTITDIVLVPQLYMLVMMTNEALTLMLQFSLAVIVMALTLASRAIREEATRVECEENETCFYSQASWIYAINLFLFLVIIFIRVLFKLRLKDSITRIRIIGPIIQFISSRKFKDFQALGLLIFLIVSVATRMEGEVKVMVNEKDEPDVQTALILLGISGTFSFWGFLVLILIYLESHHNYSHSHLVSHEELEEKLFALGERHKELLMKDRQVSKTKYCPYTRSAGPVRSGQHLRYPDY